MLSIVRLMAAEFRRTATEYVRYIGDTLSSLVALYIVFLAIFFGMKGLGGPQLPTERLDLIVVIYINWMLALTALQSSAHETVEELQRGTLEQLYLSPLGVAAILMVRSVVNILGSVVNAAVVIVLVMLTTGTWLPLLQGKVVLTLILSLPALCGIGLMMAGVVLTNKKANGLSQIATFALIGVVAVNAYPFSPLSLLPFAAGASTVRAMLLEGADLTAAWAVMLALISAVYLALGVCTYLLFQKRAKDRNLLGQY